jgi:GNAT superfamily N-acetyltransferase
MKLVDLATPGAIPVTVTHLVHHGPATPVRLAPPGVRVEQSLVDQAAMSARMYAQVGEPWSWVDRLTWSSEQWQEWVHMPGFTQWLLMRENDAAGYAELVAPSPGTVQVAYFGLLPSHVGQGLSGWWLEQVLALAWQQPGTTQVILHTCELDHPTALPNYLARGFVVERTDVEWRMADG